MSTWPPHPQVLEEISEKVHDCYFVDLFVRVSNSVAISMYRKFGYTVYRTVLGYYRWVRQCSTGINKGTAQTVLQVWYGCRDAMRLGRNTVAAPGQECLLLWEGRGTIWQLGTRKRQMDQLRPCN